MDKTTTADNFSLCGKLEVWIRPVEEGKGKTLHFSGENLITTSGKLLALDQLFYYGSGTPLSRGKVGTGGATDPGGLFLKTPTAGMTNLYTPVADVALVRSNRNTGVPSITLVASVDASQCNGLTLNEAGFFTASGVMFNIKTFPGVLKQEIFNLDLEWTISVL